VTGTRSVPSLPRLPAAGVIAVASLVAGVIVVMTLSGTPHAQAPNPAQDAQAPQSTQYAEAAPKQQPPAPQAQAPKPAQIDRNGVLIMIRSGLLALDQANKTGNCDLGSPDFQANSAARLAEIFAQQRRDNIDLSGAVIDPQLTLLPQIEANGMMHTAGFFPSVPTQVNFELAYAPVDGRWRLFGISVSFAARQRRSRLPPLPRRRRRFLVSRARCSASVSEAVHHGRSRVCSAPIRFARAALRWSHRPLRRGDRPCCPIQP
jgi:hypothetical protein